MFRKRTHDIMSKIKDKENKEVKFKVVKEECKASNTSSVVVIDRPSISKSDCSANVSVYVEEAVQAENASIGLEDAVPIWVEDTVIIENLTGDPEVGLGLDMNEVNELNFEQYNDSEHIDDLDLGLDVNCDQGTDLSVNEDSMYVKNIGLSETADRPVTQDLTKKGTVRKRKLPVESKEKREAKKKSSLKENHSVLPPCESSCFLLCSQNISEEQRHSINQAFWEKSWADRKAYILTTCERLDKKRKTTNSELISKRNKTFQYFLLGENGQKCRVCKTFFLATLGYKPKNDRFIFETLSKTPKNQISPIPDKRGKKRPANFIPKDEMEAHILSFQPQISHYRREHAPKTLYLPSDVTITLMHKDFLEKHPHSKCSYEVYRCLVRKMRISFAKLGNEECETCEQFKLHGHKENNLIDGCQECINWTKHIDAAKEARELYKAQKKIVDPTTLVVSADLQKIIMLPRVETFKKVLFTKRLVAYHESFVPVGDKPSSKPYAVVWHEAITGRNKEDLISTFYAFLKEKRDFKNIIIWLDNCSSQNKNWCFYTFLVQVINSNEITCDTIEVNYFEAGHTFMSADSFHHNVEQSLKKAGKVYDFQDFAAAVKNARKEVDVKEMTVSDFYSWKDLTSQQKLKKDPNRTYMCEIVQVKAKRGCYALEYKTSFTADNQEPRELDFLMNKVLKKKSEHFEIPEAMSAPHGFPKEKRDNILKELGGVIPENRKLFWMNLPIREVA